MNSFRLLYPNGLTDETNNLLQAIGSNMVARVACKNGETPIGIITQIAAKGEGLHAVITTFPPDSPSFQKFAKRVEGCEPGGMIDISAFHSIDYI